MEEKEWTLMSRGERENILTRIGIKKEAIDRNAKVNYAFLDEDVKQALAGTKLTVKDLVAKKDVRIIEREIGKGRQEEAWYVDKIHEMGKFLNLARETLRKGDYRTMLGRYGIARMLLNEIQERGDPSYYKQAEELLLEAKEEFAERLEHQCKIVPGE